MNRLEKFAVSTFVVVSGVVLLRHAKDATFASVPKDMPSSAHFVQSGYDLSHNEAQGAWIACREVAAEGDDYCRVTDQKGTVVYQGDFLAMGSGSRVPARNLKVSVPDANKMWVRGPVEQGPVPVISLENGQVLVPAADQAALAERWANDPEELKRATGSAD